MATRSLFRGSIQQSLVEIILIVVGVLIVLWVDGWRADIGEKKSIQQHLISIVTEIDRNRWSLHRLRDVAVPDHLSALETVIHSPNQPEPAFRDAILEHSMVQKVSIPDTKLARKAEGKRL